MKNKLIVGFAQNIFNQPTQEPRFTVSLLFSQIMTVIRFLLLQMEETIKSIVKQLLDSLKKKSAAAAAAASILNDCRCATGLTTCDSCKLKRRSLSPKTERNICGGGGVRGGGGRSLLISNNKAGRAGDGVLGLSQEQDHSDTASPMIMWQLQGNNGVFILSSTAGGQATSQLLAPALHPQHQQHHQQSGIKLEDSSSHRHCPPPPPPPSSAVTVASSGQLIVNSSQIQPTTLQHQASVAAANTEDLVLTQPHHVIVQQQHTTIPPPPPLPTQQNTNIDMKPRMVSILNPLPQQQNANQQQLQQTQQQVQQVTASHPIAPHPPPPPQPPQPMSIDAAASTSLITNTTSTAIPATTTTNNNSSSNTIMQQLNNQTNSTITSNPPPSTTTTEISHDNGGGDGNSAATNAAETHHPHHQPHHHHHMDTELQSINFDLEDFLDIPSLDNMNITYNNTANGGATDPNACSKCNHTTQPNTVQASNTLKVESVAHSAGIANITDFCPDWSYTEVRRIAVMSQLS